MTIWFIDEVWCTFNISGNILQTYTCVHWVFFTCWHLEWFAVLRTLIPLLQSLYVIQFVLYNVHFFIVWCTDWGAHYFLLFVRTRTVDSRIIIDWHSFPLCEQVLERWLSPCSCGIRHFLFFYFILFYFFWNSISIISRFLHWVILILYSSNYWEENNCVDVEDRP